MAPPSEVSLSEYYRIDNPLKANNSQRLLIGVPLVITLVFSFCFVAMNPHKPNSTITRASAKEDSKKNTKPKPLPALPTSVAAAQTLDTEATPTANTDSENSAPSGSSSAASGSGTAARSRSPQPTPAASSPKTSTPQSPGNSGRATITSKIHVTVSKPVKALLNR